MHRRLKGFDFGHIQTADGGLIWAWTIAFLLENDLKIHYENMPMQQTAIFHGCKNDNFHLKFFDYFHIFAQNIDRGYTLEPPQ